MVKNFWLLFLIKFTYKELNLKNLRCYYRTIAYEVVSISDSNDLFDFYIYEIKDLGTQEIRSYVSKSDHHVISFGKDTEKLRPGFKFCVKSTGRKQGREFVFSRYVLA